MSSELYLGNPSRDIHKWIIDSMYAGWDECAWVVDEERSTPEYLEEFKTLLEAQHPVPKYNKKSVQPSNIAEWGYVSLWNRFDPKTEPMTKDGFENIVRELDIGVETIRFPFMVFKDNEQVSGAVMYATASKTK